MSARSSVTRQLSQESDANNNNFGNSLVNCQAVQFVIPNMQPAGASLPQTVYTQPTAQYPRMGSVPNGTNPAAAYGTPRNMAPRPAMLSASVPSSFNVNASQMPVLLGADAIYRHQTPSGAAPLYTVQVGQSTAVSLQPSQQAAIVSSNQFQPNPMTNPPPTSNVAAAPFYPNYAGYAIAFPSQQIAQYPQPFAVNPQFAQANFMNGQAAVAQAFLAQQQQQQAAASSFMMPPGGGYDYGQLGSIGQVQPQAIQAAVPSSTVPNTSTAPTDVPQHQETYQPYQSQQAEQQQPPREARKKNILKIMNPETGEDVMQAAVKEQDEENRQKHQKYVGGLWKPTPEQQQQMADSADRQPSRSASATPQSTMGQGAGPDVVQNDASKEEILNDYYNAFTERLEQPVGLGAGPAMELGARGSDGQYVPQTDKVIMPPTSADYAESSVQLQFGVDEAMAAEETGIASTKGKLPKSVPAEQGIEFGWNGADENAMAAESHLDARDDVTAGHRSTSKSPVPYEAVQYESGLPEPHLADVRGSDSTFGSAQQVFDTSSTTHTEADTEGVAEDSDYDLSVTRESSKMDDSLIDQSVATSADDDKETDLSTKPDEDNEGSSLVVELEQLKDPSGKRCYSHEFMLVAAKLPTAKLKPQFDTRKWSQDNIEDVFNRKRYSSQTKSGSSKFTAVPGGTSDFSTSWMPKAPMGGPPSGRRPYPGRSSDNTGNRGGRGGGSRHGGRGSVMKQPPVILPPPTDVELKTTENAWKPGRKVEAAKDDPDKSETEKLFKEVRGILNKITPQTLDDLAQEFLSLEPRMNTKERAEGVVDIVFQKAVDEPKFCTIYSELYDRMTKLQLAKQKQQQASVGGPTKSGSITLNKETNFRYILLSKCQAEFEKESRLDAFKKEREDAIFVAETPEKKKQLQDDLDELLMKEKRQTLGNMRFIGELYHKNMLTSKIMHMCVSVLLRKSSEDEESLECLCNLLTTIGNKLESDKNSEFYRRIDEYYGQLEELSRTQQPRFKFMILDLMDLRKNGWQPRRKGDGPKTIDQIHKDIQMEKLNEKIAIEQHEMNKQLQAAQEDSPTRGSRRGGRRGGDLPSRGSYGQPDYDSRGARPSMGRDQGRQHGAGGQQQMQMAESASKFKQPALSQHLDPSSMKLGPSSMRSWSKGAGMATAAAPSAMSATLPRAGHQEPSMRTANRFENLSMADERRATGSASSSRESSQTRYEERQKAVDSVRQLVGSSTSTSKPLEHRDSLPDVQQREPADDGSSFDDDKLKRYALDLVDEMVDSGDYTEASRLICERRSVADRILSYALNHVVEKGEKHRKAFGQLIARLHAVEERPANISKGFTLFIRTAVEEDIASDVPKLWQYVGQVIATALLQSESDSAGQRLMLTEFRDAFREAEDSTAAELLAQTLLALKRDSPSEDVVVRAYRSVSDRLATDFSLDDDRVAKVFQKHKLDFLLSLPSTDAASSLLPSRLEDSGRSTANGNTVREIPPAAMAYQCTANFPYGLPSSGTHGSLLHTSGGQLEALDPDRIEVKQLLQSSEKLPVDRLIQFLQNKNRLTESDERSLAFLGALIKSLCSKIIVGGELDDNVDVDDDELNSFCKILEPFVTSQRNLEMKTLDTLSEFYNSINCPKGLLVKILTWLHEKGVIEPDLFTEWWHSGNIPPMVHSSGEVKLFFSKFVDAASDAGSESDQGE